MKISCETMAILWLCVVVMCFRAFLYWPFFHVLRALPVPNKHMGSVGGIISKYAKVKNEKYSEGECISFFFFFLFFLLFFLIVLLVVCCVFSAFVLFPFDCAYDVCAMWSKRAHISFWALFLDCIFFARVVCLTLYVRTQAKWRYRLCQVTTRRCWRTSIGWRRASSSLRSRAPLWYITTTYAMHLPPLSHIY